MHGAEEAEVVHVENDIAEHDVENDIWGIIFRDR